MIALRNFAAIYPEYDYVFFGDNGQARSPPPTSQPHLPTMPALPAGLHNQDTHPNQRRGGLLRLLLQMAAWQPFFILFWLNMRGTNKAALTTLLWVRYR